MEYTSSNAHKNLKREAINVAQWCLPIFIDTYGKLCVILLQLSSQLNICTFRAFHNISKLYINKLRHPTGSPESKKHSGCLGNM